MLGFEGGAIGADIHVERSGVHARTIGDAAKVLDALRDPAEGYYDPRDPFTTVPRSSILKSYASYARGRGKEGALTGLRIGIIRESMTVRPGNLTEVPITTAAAKEIKTVLGGKLGATLVESSDPLWKPDPEIEQMVVDYRIALARLVPVIMPDILFRLDEAGQPLFIRRGSRADRIPAGQDLRLGQDEADGLHGRACRRAYQTAVQSRPCNRAAPGAADRIPLPHQSVPVAARGRLAGEGIQRDAR
jgi:Asp-tRNA(Asn)/Glu-tRNA(Gln) amidotransferase A subunit family amidase